MSSNNSQEFLISLIKDLYKSNTCPNHNTTLINGFCDLCPLYVYHNQYNLYDTTYLIYKHFYWSPTSTADYNIIMHNHISSKITFNLINYDIKNIFDILHIIDKYHVFK